MDHAKEVGLDIISITDHDTLTSTDDIKRLAEDRKITLIPGVEFSTIFEEIPIHILGYFIDRHSQPVISLLEKAKGSRHERNIKMIELFKREGIEITWEELKEIAGSDVIARPHFAELLVQKDITRTKQEAFYEYLADQAKCCPARKELPAEEVTKGIAKSGGISCLAHPSIYGLKTEKEYDDFIGSLSRNGLTALEVYGTRHKPEKAAFFLKLAKKYNLIPLGGSDFHGENKMNAFLGKFYGIEEVYTNLEPELKQRGYA